MTHRMNIRLTIALGTAAWLACASAPAQPTRPDFGKREYEASCAACHGIQGRGDGPYKPYLTRSPSDLSTLAKSNRGVLPFNAIYEVVDGRRTPEGHGTRDMPIWGNVYRIAAAADYMEVPYDPERYVRTRILALIEYIDRLQQR